MKAKVYPLGNMINETHICASPFNMHLAIICASLAKGTSTIKGILNSNDVDTTIAWCQALGAVIKKSSDKIVVKGVNNNFVFNTSLFTCGNTSNTAKLMLPLLSTISQPFGIKGSEKVLNELASLTDFYNAYGINCYLENELIRFENTMNCIEHEFDGDIDIYLAAGILLALPLLEENSIFKLRAPVRSEKSYSMILKVLKQFRIDIKHPATMVYEISGNQKFIANNVSTEMDYFYLSHVALLSQKLDDEQYLKILNYKYNKVSHEVKLFDFMCDSVFVFKKFFPKNSLKKKQFEFKNCDLIVENSLPLLMILSSINTNVSVITKVDLSKKRIKDQFDIISKIFDKLSIEYNIYNDELVVNPKKVNVKKQVDCNKDPYIAMAISILALLSDAPIIIKNAECIYDVYKDFFNDLKSFGATIEFIHDH